MSNNAQHRSLWDPKSPRFVCIAILQPCKSSKPGIHIILLDCYSPTVSNLCIVSHLMEYLKRTTIYSCRFTYETIFSSYQKPHSTVSLLIRHNICMSKINHEIGWHTYMWFYQYIIFYAHRCRSASTSAAKVSCLSLSEIFKSAGATAFARFYDQLLIL